jgi:hypothetical protein
LVKVFGIEITVLHQSIEESINVDLKLGKGIFK